MIMRMMMFATITLEDVDDDDVDDANFGGLNTDTAELERIGFGGLNTDTAELERIEVMIRMMRSRLFHTDRGK